MSDTSLVHNPNVNLPDYAAEEMARLELEYDNLEAEVVDFLGTLRALPASIEDGDIGTASQFTEVVKRGRDLDARIEGLRILEKTPHLRRGDANDSFFFAKRERLARRKKTDKAGGVDVVLARLNDYNQRRLAAEERQRQAEAERLRQEEQKRRDEEAAALRAAQDAAAAAERARKPENIVAHEEAAAHHQQAADIAGAAASIARENRIEAESAARAKPADMVRERHESGAINTMKQVWHVEVEDPMKLDVVRLWPFIPADAIEKALKSWAKTTQYKQKMDGAIIEQRAETVVR